MQAKRDIKCIYLINDEEKTKIMLAIQDQIDLDLLKLTETPIEQGFRTTSKQQLRAEFDDATNTSWITRLCRRYIKKNI
jgi:hypothetical protein